MSYTACQIEIGGFVGRIDYKPQSDSYVASIRRAGDSQIFGIVLATAAFGNGVRAEEWILEQMQYPELLLLKRNFG